MIDGEENKTIEADCGTITYSLSSLQSNYSLNLLIYEVNKIQPFSLKFYMNSNDSVMDLKRIQIDGENFQERDSLIEISDSLRVVYSYKNLVARPRESEIIIDFNKMIICDDKPIKIPPQRVSTLDTK
ncbi:MAG: hypothetical protein WC967_15395 [Balneolaceae bacterium]